MMFVQHKLQIFSKVCVFDLVQDFIDNISYHFYNQSKIINSEGNTKWGCLNKIKDTWFTLHYNIHKNSKKKYSYKRCIKI